VAAKIATNMCMQANQMVSKYVELAQRLLQDTLTRLSLKGVWYRKKCAISRWTKILLLKRH